VDISFRCNLIRFLAGQINHRFDRLYDDFNQSQVISQTLTLDVIEAEGIGPGQVHDTREVSQFPSTRRKLLGESEKFSLVARVLIVA
jgi:hypothetical protein